MSETREFPDDEPGRHSHAFGGHGVPDDTPDATTDAEVDEIEADETGGADPTASAREGVGMAAEPGSDDDPASYLNP